MPLDAWGGDKLDEGETSTCNVPWIGKIAHMKNIMWEDRGGESTDCNYYTKDLLPGI
jgi:hypothetical protein